jgi:hypothetical protein
MATEEKPRSKPTSSDYHTPRTVEEVTEHNVQAILQLEEADRSILFPSPFSLWLSR